MTEVISLGTMVFPSVNPIGWNMYDEPNSYRCNYDADWDANLGMYGVVVEIQTDFWGQKFYKILTSAGRTGWVPEGFLKLN